MHGSVGNGPLLPPEGLFRSCCTPALPHLPPLCCIAGQAPNAVVTQALGQLLPAVAAVCAALGPPGAARGLRGEGGNSSRISYLDMTKSHKEQGSLIKVGVGGHGLHRTAWAHTGVHCVEKGLRIGVVA